MEIGKDFKDIIRYNKEMTKPMEDKLFFIDKLPPGDRYLFVDFGCADGALIQNLIGIFGNKSCRYVGYDCSETMIAFAKTSFSGGPSDSVEFTSDWNTVEQDIIEWKKLRYKTVLILSSVIHEIYSYETEESIKEFWEKTKDFDIVVIRDMMYADTIKRESDQDSTIRIRKGSSSSALRYLEQFEERWGSIDENKNLVHYLLKYRYTINWERECNENYFPISIKTLIDKMEGTLGFVLDYFEKFRVKFIEEKIYEDFGIVLEDTTHIKAIFRKR